MRASALLVPMILVMFPAVLVLCPEGVYASEMIWISDEPGDVLRTGYVETGVEGEPEVDIISLVSTESISDVTVVMEFADDMDKSADHLYTISISGIHVSYQDGTFEVWRIGSELQPLDNVLTDVTENRMTVIVKKTMIVGEFILNGTANRYVIDLSRGVTSESYFDLVGDVDGSRAPSVGEYTKSYVDPRGDVRLLYLDVEPFDEDGLDIYGVTIELSDDLELILELGGAPLQDEQVRYIIYLLDLKVVWSMGEAEALREGEDPAEVSSSIEGSSIYLTIPSEMVPGELGGIVVQSLRSMDDEAYVQDLLPDDPYTVSELLPFPPGSEREFSLEVRGPDNIVMKRNYTGFSDQAERDIRASMDLNADDDLNAGEVQEFMSVTLESIHSAHSGDLTMDGRSGELQVTLLHEGLVGPVDGDGRVVIGWELEFSFDVSGAGPHHLDVNIDRFDPSILPTLSTGEDETSFKVVVSVAEGWYILPTSVEPTKMANFLDMDGRDIGYPMTGKDAREFDAGAISFELLEVKDPGKETDDDDGSDLTWLYVIILLVMVAVIAGTILWSGREER